MRQPFGVEIADHRHRRLLRACRERPRRRRGPNEGDDLADKMWIVLTFSLSLSGRAGDHNGLAAVTPLARARSSLGHSDT
jgi:hypothetical protein